MGNVITAIDSYVPSAILNNFELETIVDTTNEWLLNMTGIAERRIAPAGTSSANLMAAATRNLIQNYPHIKIDEEPLVVGATSFAKENIPLTADDYALEIKVPNNTTVLDANDECASFCYALSIADAMMSKNPKRYPKALVASGDVTTTSVDYTDRGTCGLFGDAGAVVELTNIPSEEGIIGCDFRSDRDYYNCLSAPFGGVMHFGPKGGPRLMEAILKSTPKLFEEFCEDYSISISDIDMVIPHQLNIRVTTPVKEWLIKKGLRDGAYYDRNIYRFGNCAGTSIPLALHYCYMEGLLKPNDLVILIGWGAGVRIGIVALRWTLPQIVEGGNNE